MRKEIELLKAEYDAMPAMVKVSGGAFFRQLFAVLNALQAGIVHAEGMAGRSERD